MQPCFFPENYVLGTDPCYVLILENFLFRSILPCSKTHDLWLTYLCFNSC